MNRIYQKGFMLLSKVFIVALLVAMCSTKMYSQMTGTKTIPSVDFPTLKVAVDSLNLYGVGAGGVIINVTAGYTEPLTATLSLTATGTAANPIVIQKFGAGANPSIIAPTGGTAIFTTTTTLDGIFRFVGSDWVTLDGINLNENPSNTGTALMEYGLAFYKVSGTNGCNRNTIQNCVITLNRNNTLLGTILPEIEAGSCAIFAANATFSAPSVALTVTTAAGTNSNNIFYSNTLQNCNVGLSMRGFTDGISPFLFYDQNTDIGGATPATANYIINYGGCIPNPSALAAAGIKVVNVNAANISNNIVTSIGGGAAHLAEVKGIFNSSPNAALMTFNNNTVSTRSGIFNGFITNQAIDAAGGSLAAASVINMTNNVITNCIIDSGLNIGNNSPGVGLRVTSSTAVTINITGNQIFGDTMFNVGTFTGIAYGGTNLNAVVNITTNQIYNIYKANGNPNTFGGNRIDGITSTAGKLNISNNQLHDLSIVNIINTTGNVTDGLNCTLNGMNISVGNSTTSSITNNQLYNFSIAGPSSNSGTATAINGIQFGGNTGIPIINLAISGNTLYNFNGFIAAGTNAINIRGIEITAGFNNKVFNNKLYDFTANARTATVIGFRVLAGQNLDVYNNYMGNFFTPIASLGAAPEQVIGISEDGTAAGQNHNFYFNTINLTGTSTGTNFGSSVFKVSTTGATVPTVTLRNNLFINNTNPAGLGTAVVYRRAIVGLTTYGLASNNNIFYAGAPAVNRLIYFDGTNSDQTLLAFKARAAGRDNASATENTPFLSTVGSSSNFLHVNTAIATAAESGGVNIAGITTDYDADIRQGNVGYLGSGTAPDIGADEFGGIISDSVPPAINAGIILGSCGNGDRIISGVIITDATGVPIAGGLVPRIYYKRNIGGTYVSSPGVLNTGNGTNGSWTFTITAASLPGLTTGDSVLYYFIAQDVVGTPNISSVPFGAVATNVNSVSTHPTVVSQYKILNSLSGTYTVGAGRNFTNITAAIAAYNSSCLSGPVTFLLKDANYTTETFPIIINANPFASATNTLTIRPDTSVANPSGNVSIQATTLTHVFALLGADFVTFEGSKSPVKNTLCPLVRSTRNLTIQNNNTTATNNAVIFVASNGFDGCTNDTIRNCNIIGGAVTNGIVGIAFGAGPVATGISTGTASLGFGNNNNCVENDSIVKCSNGITSQGFSFAIKNQNNTYRMNIMTATGANVVSRYGILLGFENNALVTGNQIANMTGVSGTDIIAINLGNVNGVTINAFSNNEVTNSVISKNVIDSIRTFATTGAHSAVGIAVSNAATGAASSGTNLIANNMISRVSANANSNDITCGIMIGNQIGATTQIYNNTVNMNAAGFATNTTSTLALYVAGSGVIPSIDLKNNILSTSTSLGSGNNFVIGLQVQGNVGNYANFLSDNNDLFVKAGNGFFNSIGVVGTGASPSIIPGTTNFPTLASWQAQTGRDANSKNVQPVFVSASNMHLVTNAPVNVNLNGTAMVIGTITDDIDCDARTGVNSPDIGADEFTLPPIDIAFDALKPTQNTTCHGPAESVIVTVRNTGSSIVDFASTPITVTCNVTGTITTATSGALNVGTLAANATVDITLTPTINTSANGSYTFTTAISTIAGEFSITNNDNVTTFTINNSLPTVTTNVFADTLCLGFSTPITATGINGTLPYTYSWTPASGLNTTTGASVTAAPTSQTTYIVTVTDACGNTSSATAFVDIFVPGVASTVPGSRCGIGTVGLSAVPNPGSSLIWYNNAVGGSIATTGNTYTTPSISSSTNFYVSAKTTGNVPYYVGLTDLNPANGAVTFTSGAQRGQMITANKTGAITGCIVYPSNAATITAAMSGGLTRPIQFCLRLRGSTTNIATAGPFQFTLAQLGTPVQLKFNIPIAATGDYQLVYDTVTGGGVTNLNQVGLAQYSFSYTGTYPLYTADSSLVMPGGHSPVQMQPFKQQLTMHFGMLNIQLIAKVQEYLCWPLLLPHQHLQFHRH